MGVYVTTFGTGVVPDEKISKVVSKVFDFRPAAIVKTLDLLRPIYTPTAAYGHFTGRTEKSFTWERTDRAESAWQGAPAQARTLGLCAPSRYTGDAMREPPLSTLSGWGRHSAQGRERVGEDLERISADVHLSRGLGRSYGDASLLPTINPTF